MHVLGGRVRVALRVRAGEGVQWGSRAELKDAKGGEFRIELKRPPLFESLVGYLRT